MGLPVSFSTPAGQAYAESRLDEVPMDGRWVTLLLLLVLPAALIGVTIQFFSSNPVSIFTCLAVMVVGAFYLLSYTETFA